MSGLQCMQYSQQWAQAAQEQGRGRNQEGEAMSARRSTPAGSLVGAPCACTALCY